MKSKIKYCLLFIILFSSHLFGALDFEFIGLDDKYITSGYNPFNPNSLTLTEQYSIKNTGTSTSKAFSTADNGLQGEPDYTRYLINENGDLLEYQLYSDQNETADDYVLKEVGDDTNANNAMTHRSSIRRNRKRNYSYTVRMAPQQFVPSGTYSDSITFNLYGGAWADNPVASFETNTIQLSIDVIEYFLLSTNPDHAQENLLVDMGEIVANGTQSFPIYIVSNAAYEVTVQSDNNQTLKHLTPGINSSQAYIFKMAGSSVDLSSGLPVSIIESPEGTTVTGDQIDLEVSFPSTVPMLSEGNYQDILHLTLTSP